MLFSVRDDMGLQNQLICKQWFNLAALEYKDTHISNVENNLDIF